MYYIVDTEKSFYEATLALEPIIQRLGFQVLAGHQLADLLASRGEEFDDECKVFAVTNGPLAERLLRLEWRLHLALPWAVTVFTEDGNTRIGTLLPTRVLGNLTTHPEVMFVARELEERLRQIVDEAR